MFSFKVLNKNNKYKYKIKKYKLILLFSQLQGRVLNHRYVFKIVIKNVSIG